MAVAGTAFSASRMAFLVAPNPVTAGSAIGTGLLWPGVEIWDHREELSRRGRSVTSSFFTGEMSVVSGASDLAGAVGSFLSPSD